MTRENRKENIQKEANELSEKVKGHLKKEGYI